MSLCQYSRKISREISRSILGGYHEGVPEKIPSEMKGWTLNKSSHELIPGGMSARCTESIY